ncbi:hypothetical protein B0T16DRAFT_506765 [Cercophora newfieldiana]|uniref:NmrA-like domain-containing protein n=1 Tax=Cercophora newfieldiana TaxID=92897 RepID=A0AA40CRY1_9PEZI|nr:hypothetical protein B0T16DRAFT_506765 [Cercophora newfieldiana]
MKNCRLKEVGKCGEGGEEERGDERCWAMLMKQAILYFATSYIPGQQSHGESECALSSKQSQFILFSKHLGSTSRATHLDRNIFQFAMAYPFKNALLIGAGGSIDSIVLKALLAEPSLSVTVLKRESSHAALPPHVPSVTVPDSYPTDKLVEAFRGHDAIINCMTSVSIANQFRFIDAAIAAGVRRCIPSKYGLNNMRPDAQALNAVFRDKGAVQTYLRERAAEDRIEWMSISCGVRQKEFTLYDEGEGRFSVTTEENTALGLVRSLVQKPAETKNQNVLLSEFVTTQKQLLAEIERQTGQKFAVDRIDSYAKIPELQKALIEAGFVAGRYGADLPKEGKLFNEMLSLKGHHTLEEIVADALENLK